MKKLIIIVFVFLIYNLTFNIDNCKSQWHLNYIMNLDENLESLCAVDSLSVWGVGTKDGSVGVSDTSICYKMLPPGIWKRLPIPYVGDYDRITCIAATDTSNALFGTQYGKIYRTSNGGYNWTVAYDFGWNWHVSDIKFSKINKLVGYANSNPPSSSSAPVKIIKTTNGGINWTDCSSVVSGNSRCGTSCVTDPNHYWMSMYEGTTYIPKILFTTNGGTNWQIFAPDNPAIVITSIEFSSNNLLGLYSCYVDSQPGPMPVYMYKTTNGGLSWPTHYLLPVITGQSAFDIHFIEGTSKWYFANSNGNGNHIFKSTDNGEHWNAMVMDLYKDQVMTMSLIKKNNKVWGYAATNNRKVFQLHGEPVGIRKIESTIPVKYLIYQNYPNPFNPVTKIRFEIPPLNKGGQGSETRRREEMFSLKVYDILGKEIETLLNESALGGQPGIYEVTFDGSNLPGGIYFYTLKTEGYSDTKKMILVK